MGAVSQTRTSARADAVQYAGYAQGCAGDCGYDVIPPEMLGELSKRAQRILYEMNVRVAHEYGACKRCVVKVRKLNAPKKPTREELAEQKRHEVTELWEQIRVNGGGRKELAETLGVTRQAVDHYVRSYDLPVEDTPKQRFAIFQEELEFFLSCGLGVHEIAGRFGLTAEELVRKVDSLRNKGKTTIRFYGWQREESAT